MILKSAKVIGASAASRCWEWGDRGERLLEIIKSNLPPHLDPPLPASIDQSESSAERPISKQWYSRKSSLRNLNAVAS